MTSRLLNKNKDYIYSTDNILKKNQTILYNKNNYILNKLYKAENPINSINDNMKNSIFNKFFVNDFTKSVGNISIDSIMIAISLVIAMMFYSIIKSILNLFFTIEEFNLIAKLIVTFILIVLYVIFNTYIKKGNYLKNVNEKLKHF